MSFAGKVWRLLVGIKDGLALVFLLLFFSVLFMVLTARPSPAQVQEGALLLNLDGYVVEEKSSIDPLSMLISGQEPVHEFDVQDLVHAIDAAAKDDRIKVVVLDLSRFLGGGQVHMEDIGAALDRVRAAGKPVLAWSAAYTDDGMMLAAHSSEVWVDPLGGAVIAGPGGNRLYYKDLLDRLKVEAHVYRVGTYKSAVEPYMRSDMSEPARENYTSLYGAMWSEWKANVTKARPGMDVEKVTTDPVGWLEAAKGDFATAAKQAGLVDRIGDRVAFGKRVAEIAGKDDWDDTPGAYAHTDLAPWLADNPMPDDGKAIGVITIAGEIVDGDAGPGTAGGDRIAQLLDDALDKDLAALVVRVDSPGGSVMASEEIRRAIMRQKARGIPVVVSMANVAASGGYWVSTPADRIFAEPDTVTGSIGIFAVVPTFEKAAAHWGLHSDGVRTTPLSGQPDLVAGFTPEINTMLQDAIEDGYHDFLSRVAQSRKMTTEQVDKIGQGRVWDGGAARQIGLVDQYGGLPDALEYAAKQAGLKDGDWHADYLGKKPGEYDSILRRLLFSRDNDARGNARGLAQANDIFALASARQAGFAGQMASDIKRLTGTRGMQAYCLECPASPQAREADAREGQGWLALLARLVG